MMYEQGVREKRERTQASYQEIKEHFMTRFQLIDRELITYSQQPPNLEADQQEEKLITFI